MDPPANRDKVAGVLNQLSTIPLSPSKPLASPRLPPPSPSRLEASLSEQPYDIAHDHLPQNNTILYLAYGSNLCYRTFQDRRGIRPLAAINVIVPELKLTFDLPGIPYVEPCFANSALRSASKDDPPTLGLADDEGFDVNKGEHSLVPTLDADSQPLIGVVYEVTPSDFARIIATEGPTYGDKIVVCYPLSDSLEGALEDESSAKPASPPLNPSYGTVTSPSSISKSPFHAHTLLAPPTAARLPNRKHPAQPSLRYLTLIRNGAAEHSLPSSYQSYLASLQHYRMTTKRQSVGRVLLLALWLPFFAPLLGLYASLAKWGKKRPWWLIRFGNLLSKGVWATYDSVFWRVFGEGERTMDGKK